MEIECFDFCSPIFMIAICILVIWKLVWKGFALWKAARNNHSAWFICIIVFNTIGILPIIYILMNRNKKVTMPKMVGVYLKNNYYIGLGA